MGQKKNTWNLFPFINGRKLHIAYSSWYLIKRKFNPLGYFLTTQTVCLYFTDSLVGTPSNKSCNLASSGKASTRKTQQTSRADSTLKRRNMFLIW